MKLLHTSDWHLGMTMRGGHSLIPDQEYAIGKIIETAEKEGVDGILLAGDVFDKSIASFDALELLDRIMEHICCELGIPVYMIAGNHDGAARLSQHRKLLSKSGLYIAGSLEREPNMVRVSDVDIYMLPWISTDKVRTVYPESADKISSLEDAYRIVLDDYRSRFSPGQKNILLSHAFITNALTSVSDKSAEAGGAAMVSAAVFEGFDYVALGHLHAPQAVNNEIRYSGSPCIYSFGKEEKQEKSVVIIDSADMSQKTISVPQLRKRTTLKGTYDELMKADFDAETLDGYVRLEVTDSYVGLDSIALFRERYRNLLEISGRDFEKEDSKITMSIDELEDAGTEPGYIFDRYCLDILGIEADRRLKDKFRAALEQYNREHSL